MLVPFVIDANSLAPDPEWTSAQQRACYNSLIDVWQRSGLLVHDGDSLNASRLYQAVQALPQNVRPRWQEVLARSPLLAAPGWDGEVSAATLGHFSGTAQLAMVDDTRAEVEFHFDVECDEAPCRVNGIDVTVCRILSAGQAGAFKNALTMSNTHIEEGDTYQSTWNARFKALAMAPIKLVSVVDRYAMGLHMVHAQTQLSGLERFLRLLDNDATGHRYVSVYSAWTENLAGDNRKSIEDIETELRVVLGRLPRKNIKRIKIIMVQNSVFGNLSHDRFVRFGEYVWDIGCGLDVFDGTCAARRSSAGFNAGAVITGYKAVEDALARSSAAQSREI